MLLGFGKGKKHQSTGILKLCTSFKKQLMKSSHLLLFLSFFILLSTTSCNKNSLGIFSSPSARAQYLNMLDKSGLADSKVGRSWEAKGNEVLTSPNELTLPTSIQGTFKSKSVEASAWSISLDKGASIKIFINWNANDSSKLIVDLLETPSFEEVESHAIIQDSLLIEAAKTGQYLLRIQPELLGEGNFQILISSNQTYAVFPVQGKNTASIQSYWGAARDAGARSHEGVDIFASRGTPVLAPVDGMVTSVRDRGLGGKQVWLRDGKRNWHLYFAHLDSQLVNNLDRVKSGDTLGLVGNTGNARTTAPHLHFGIYDNGAFNPFPVINTEHAQASLIEIKDLPNILLINVPQANVRSGPSTKTATIFQLTESEPVFITAATEDWYEIKTVNGTSGFIYQNLLSKPVEQKMDSNFRSVYSSIENLSESLLVDLGGFSKIAELESYEIITDADENIYFTPKIGLNE